MPVDRTVQPVGELHLLHQPHNRALRGSGRSLNRSGLRGGEIYAGSKVWPGTRPIFAIVATIGAYPAARRYVFGAERRAAEVGCYASSIKST